MIRFTILTALLAVLVGCSSIVAPGKTKAEVEESGATKWALSEYDHGEFHYVWIPTWTEGLLGLSTPTATNAKSLTVLKFRDGVLIDSLDIGRDREDWAALLEEHGRFKNLPGTVEADPLYLAVTLRIVHIGATKEALYFASGFPRYGARYNPRAYRAPSTIGDDDVLYYIITRGGDANEVVLKGGKVAEIRPAEHLGKDFSNFYHPIVLP